MTSFLQYVLEVSICISMFLVIYIVFLKGQTFFQLNRMYLLSGLILSFIVPLVTLPQHIPQGNSILRNLNTTYIETEYLPVFVSKEGTSTSMPDLMQIVALIYVIGVCLFIVRFFAGLWSMIQLKRKSVRKEISGVQVYVQHSLPTFSFVNIVFASPDVQPLEIEHEQVHIQQKHWMDSLAVEIATTLLWFNPLVFAYKRALKNEHEFLADQGAIDKHTDVEVYLHSLLNATLANNRIPVSSHFGSKHIKHRIIMLTKNKTPLYKAMLYLLIVPAVALLLFAFQDGSRPVSTGSPDVVANLQNVPDGAPIERSKIKEIIGFGERLHPATNKMRHHTGIDFSTDEGVEVMATADGTVVETTYNDMKGNFVVIRHSDQFVTQYYHLQKSQVTKGATIKKGQVIGLVGSTGVLSTGNHLHYEVLKDGTAVNPAEYLPKGYSE
ncbi:MAG TPA: M23/M56 family metallopeptidase [Chryseosolibacter sp.]